MNVRIDQLPVTANADPGQSIPAIKDGLTVQLFISQIVSLVKAEIVNGAPTDLDTLNELAAALNDDNDFATSVLSQLAEISANTHGYKLRSELVDAIANGDFNTFSDGTIRVAQGLNYVKEAAATQIADMPGWKTLVAAQPRRDFVVTPYHFGTDAAIATNADAAILAAVNAAASSPGGKVVIPKGIYRISPDLNLLRDGLVMEGEGRNVSQFVIDSGAGGVGIGRAWTTGVANDYLQDVVLRDFGVIMQHPATAAPANYRQVAFDLSHVTRSVCHDLYAGSYSRGISEGVIANPSNQPNARQGVAFLGMSTSDGNPGYSGGEVNRYEGCHVAGAQKGFVLDDPEFFETGYSSASYANHFSHCEAQIAELAFGQLSQYGAGNMWNDCRSQSIDQATGSSNVTYEFQIYGFDNTIIGGYSESPNVDKALFFGTTAKRNNVLPRLWGANFATKLQDDGQNNSIHYIDAVTGENVLLFNGKNMNRGQPQAFVTWSVTGGVVTILDSWGVGGVTRNGTGDHTILFETGTFANDKYAYALSGSVNASGHSGIVYPYDGDDIDQTQIRVLSRNLNTSAGADFMKYSAVFFGGQ